MIRTSSDFDLADLKVHGWQNRFRVMLCNIVVHFPKQQIRTINQPNKDRYTVCATISVIFFFFSFSIYISTSTADLS